MKPRSNRQAARKAAVKGFTLVELMISMVLGLVVVGAVVSVLLANKRTYNTTGAMSQVQESARTAFELLARDLRQAGATGCDNSGRVANVLTGSVYWWQNWFGLTGFDGSATDTAVATGTNPGERVNGTDSLQLQTLVGNGLSVATHDTANTRFVLTAATSDVAANDVLIVCDFDHATMFKATAYDSTNFRVSYASTGTPPNCSNGLGFPTNCTAANSYTFARNSQIAHLATVDWYIGNNGRAADGGRSLYRRRLTNAGTPNPPAEEVVAGVTDMQILYRVDGTDTFVDAGSVTAANWPKVNAISIQLTATSADQRVSSDASANSGRLERRYTWTLTLRNRVP